MSKWPTLKEFLTGWKSWGPPAIATAVAPWLLRVAELDLITPYYQPGLNGATSALIGISAYLGYGWLVRNNLAYKRRVLVAAAVVFVLSLVGCLLVDFGLRQGLSLSAGAKEFVSSLVHRGLYVLTFCSLMIALLAAFLLMPRPKAGAGR